MDGNLLYYGDNLDVLRQHVKEETVDLVYLDPPFNSNASYNVLFAEHGTRSAAQIHAFEDTWRWDESAAYDYQQTVEQGGRVADTLRGLRTVLGTSDMLAYLSMMAPRLLELRRVMKPTASIYLHCDPTASHYLKLLMDAVFGPVNFRNEIVWHYRRWTGGARRFLSMHDVLLFYAKDHDQIAFNRLYTPYTDRSLARKQNYHTRIKGDDVYVTSVNPQGVAENDVWDIQLLNSQSLERLGYPTQKPLALLERIIAASSSPGDLVLDPFCGCGTTIDAAQKLGRRWIGIDITHLAVGLIKHRLEDAYGPRIADTYRVVGEPTDEDGARELAADDPFQFQAWALGLVGARVASSAKKGGDKGIDGRLYFHDGGATGGTSQIIFSVKAGGLNPAYLRELRGTIDREEAQIGVLLTFEPSTAGMRAEAASAGFYSSPMGGNFPRLQLLTVGQILEGKQINYPHRTGGNVTLRRAQRELKVADQGELGYGDSSGRVELEASDGDQGGDQMARVDEFHTDTDSDDYGDEASEVYHNRSECGYGQRVKRDGNAVDGRGVGRRLCKECAKFAA